MFRQRAVCQIRDQRQRHRQVYRRFIQAQPTHNVDINVGIAKKTACALFQHGQQQRRTVVVKPGSHAAGLPKAAFGHQGLHLHQDRAAALHHADNAGAGNLLRPAGKEHFRGVFHRFQPPFIH